MAAAFVSGCDSDSDVAIPCCHVGLWADSWPGRPRRVWIESAESAACDTRAYRYAARARNFSDRSADLGKNPSGNGVETGRTDIPLCIANSGNVDQGSDCLRVSASRNRHQCCSRRPVGDARASHSEAATDLAWSATGRIRRGELVAMDRFTGGVPAVGDRRDFVYAWLL